MVKRQLGIKVITVSWNPIKNTLEQSSVAVGNPVLSVVASARHSTWASIGKVNTGSSPES